MKVLGINSSPRQDGNTALLIQTVLNELEQEGIETELINISGKITGGCVGCRMCAKNKDRRCINNNDMFNEVIEKMAAADGIILGSPTYFVDVTVEMKALIERAGMVSKANGDLLKYKVGASVVAVRRGGAIRVFETMNHFMHYMQMFQVGASYWNMGFGLNKGDVGNDAEGIKNMKVLGQNMAYLLKKLNS